MRFIWPGCDVSLSPTYVPMEITMEVIANLGALALACVVMLAAESAVTRRLALRRFAAPPSSWLR